jgi:hypothetical protein
LSSSSSSPTPSLAIEGGGGGGIDVNITATAGVGDSNGSKLCHYPPLIHSCGSRGSSCCAATVSTTHRLNCQPSPTKRMRLKQTS